MLAPVKEFSSLKFLDCLGGKVRGVNLIIRKTEKKVRASVINENFIYELSAMIYFMS